MDAVIDRIADVLERVSAQVDGLSHQIFVRDRTHRRRGALIKFYSSSWVVKARPPLRHGEFGVVVAAFDYVANEAEGLNWAKEKKLNLKVLSRDVTSLTTM